MTITILIAGYLLCCYFGWRYIHLSYNKDGQWEGMGIGLLEVVFVFVPIINYISVPLFYLISSPREKASEFWYKFFKIKK